MIHDFFTDNKLVRMLTICRFRFFIHWWPSISIIKVLGFKTSQLETFAVQKSARTNWATLKRFAEVDSCLQRIIAVQKKKRCQFPGETSAFVWNHGTIVTIILRISQSTSPHFHFKLLDATSSKLFPRNEWRSSAWDWTLNGLEVSNTSTISFRRQLLRYSLSKVAGSWEPPPPCLNFPSFRHEYRQSPGHLLCWNI